MRLCSCCRRPAAPTGQVKPMIAPGLYYLLLWNCPSCDSTLAVTMWESEET